MDKEQLDILNKIKILIMDNEKLRKENVVREFNALYNAVANTVDDKTYQIIMDRKRLYEMEMIEYEQSK